jgi:glycosyltransferase involved in cell wall biosynthesis
MKVSVLIATYGEYLWSELARARAYPSAIAQDPFETIVGHDTDATIAIARNGLAEKATGDWLCFLDADDELGPGYLRAMRRASEQERGVDGAPLLLTPAVSYVHNGRRRTPMFHPIGDFRDDNYLVVGTVVQRDLFFKVGGFGDYPHGFEDWSLWAKCWKAGARVVQVKRATYYAHVNPNSKHRQGWKDRAWQVATHQKVRSELFPELA